MRGSSLELSGGGGRTTDDVRQEPSVGDLLIGHELNQEAVISVEPGGLEFRDRELGKAVFEKVELDILLIKGQSL